MNTPFMPPGLPDQLCQVFASHDVFVTLGVNLGEGLSSLDEVCLGDMYVLAQGATPQKLLLEHDGDSQIVSENSTLGAPGAGVTITARFTMLAPGGDKLELLALHIAAMANDAGGYFILPLSPMGERIEYTLIRAEEPQPDERLIDLLCISFARGTMITLGDGSQKPIERLLVGDRVLTRDHGPQALLWIGHVTLRAVGAYAPVVIAAGVLGNEADLVVSQHHRMFLYQRNRAKAVPKAEILVQAKHLVNGDTVYLREIGFVDYYSLVFDAHEIIYAEGIPAESLMVTEATVSRLPPELAAEVKLRFPEVSHIQHFGVEAGANDLAALGLNAAKHNKGER
ncbi:Hint domain-containing protein [Pseudorhodobacter sp. W20_MBD10_FR17]|uniref:Hint domain-containing protein n=1 Tax=Pseudorhodobacter sp. W20_MBD10_FR17 TaxID=3240266 RepID=UPI003F9D8367